MSYDILNRWTKAVIYHSDTATTAKECVEQAVRDRASLVGASLVGASLDRASLVGASLDGASLDRASLVGASLVGASLDRASLVGASLVGASLVGASLDGASLDGASLVGASLDGASLGDLKLIQVGGSKHWIVALLSPDGCEVRIGCQHHPLAWWLEHYAAVGRAEGYSDEQVVEYGRHLRYVAEWIGGAA